MAPNYMSSFIEVSPGDTIANALPEGVGFARQPPLLLKAGDVIEVDIPGIGLPNNPIAAE